MKRIANKIALITGASRGIGATTAQIFYAAGAHVILTDILDAEGQDLAAKLDGEYYHLDVGSAEDWDNLHALISKKYGHIDILFNNAGITGFDDDLGPQDPENISLQAWHAVHKVNLDGVFLGCKFAISLMKERGGSIVNMSSRSGIVGIPGASAYASSKAAVRNHTKSVALYCAQQGYKIRCNSVHPGAILTQIWDPMLGTASESRKEMIKAVEKGIPIGHMGEPYDVAYAVLYLASDEAKYITGIELNIDGGILAGSSATLE